MKLNKFRFFDSDKIVRDIAYELYETVKDLPIICPHGHVDPRILAKNTPFPNPAQLLIIPDHYIFRMLYSQGVNLLDLGIPTIDGTEVESDPRKIWQIFADNFYLFPGTPSGGWLSHVFNEVFEIDEDLNSGNAQSFYDRIQEKLNLPEFLPRTLFDKFKIAALNTTDAASDDLAYHKQIQESNWDGKVVPCFRPDGAINILAEGWKEEIKKLSAISKIDVIDFKSFIKALEDRRLFFKSMGAVSTDQGVFSPYTNELSESEADTIFQKALNGTATEDDDKLFTAHMLMEMARMSINDGLVMQIHPGVLRNHNPVIMKKHGLDKGCDIPVITEYANNLKPLLNKYGNNPKLKLIVFTLDESTYARELAPLAGHYPAMKLGPAWWFNDSIEGMTRYRQMVTETAGFYNTVGFNDDTRAFLSIPARHDVARRVDSNFLAGLVARHLIDKETALKLSYELANGLVKKAYNL